MSNTPANECEPFFSMFLRFSRRLLVCSRRNLNRWLRPLSQTIDARLSFPFAMSIALESLVLIGFWVHLLTLQTINPWNATLGFVSLLCLTPVLLLQILQRIFPAWSESLDFKYLALGSLLILWFASGQGSSDIQQVFQTQANNFPNALGAASFFSAWDLVSMVVMIGGFVLYIFIQLSPSKKRPITTLALLSAFFVTQAFVGIGYSSAMQDLTRKVILAQIAWETDLINAPDNCLEDIPKHLRGENSSTHKWKILLPTGEGDSVMLIHGATDLPEKPLWRFSQEEKRKFSTFDIHYVRCDLKKGIQTRLSDFEKHLLETVNLTQGITPLSRVEISK